MTSVRFTAEDHARITAAVAAAEQATDGEIVTIVTERSDAYHDVGLHYAVAAMLLVAGISASFPALFEWKLALFTGGWNDATPLAPALFLLLVGQALIFLIVRYGLEYMPLRMALTPPGTKTRRVRRRAIQFFKASAEKRTAAREGVLLYLSLAEHRAEIVADEAIHIKVTPETWGDAMAALVEQFRKGDPAAGMVAAVERIGAVLAEHLPKTEEDRNELPDRLIEL
ncbi:MAG: TPM domain-containing protein [Pseudomonadota bacterium]